MLKKNSKLWLIHKRKVRFGDTDAAGVMHFHQLLRWCHEAWEESLQCFGLPANKIFPCNLLNEEIPEIALPIIHCEASFQKPLQTGDKLELVLTPKRIDSSSFQVTTKFHIAKDEAAQGLIRHVAINAKTRQRCQLPENIDRWLEASSLFLNKPFPL